MRRPLSIALLYLLAIVLLAPSSGLASGAGSTQLVSRPDGSGPVPPALDNDSRTPGAISDDGRYAVFASDADGLSSRADPHVRNLFLRDRQTGTTTLVSRSDGIDGAGADSDSRDPAITIGPRGNPLIAFVTGASNLTDHETGPLANPGRVSEVWVRDV